MHGSHEQTIAAQVRAALNQRLPAHRWPRLLALRYEQAEAPYQHAEARFLVKIGLLVMAATMVVDAIVIPQHFADLVALRLAFVAPLQIAVLTLSLRHIRLQRALVAASLITFGMILLRASFWAPAPVNAYMAIGPIILFGVGLPVLPLGRQGQAAFVLTSLAGLLAVAALVDDPVPGSLVLLTIAVLTAVFALIIGGRYRNLAERNFLLGQVAEMRLTELEDSNRKLSQLSQIDPLTQLANRRHATETFERDYALVPVAGEARVAVLLLDLDHFKDFNDRWGHQAGDRCLIAVARLMQHFADLHGGIAARFGGEEFVVLFRAETRTQALAAAEEVRRAIEVLELPLKKDETTNCTISIGVALHIGDGAPDLALLIGEADAALYEAKRSGRNRSVCRSA